ncbi:hypothetical protein FACS1894204_12470 [Synergistales bacterium]|nr:hypothetical protein FACS1894204_12470 [Synergistales bacterium]
MRDDYRDDSYYGYMDSFRDCNAAERYDGLIDRSRYTRQRDIDYMERKGGELNGVS